MHSEPAGSWSVLARSSLDKMTTPQSGTLAGAATGGYGLGLRLLLGGSGVVAGSSGLHTEGLPLHLLDAQGVWHWGNTALPSSAWFGARAWVASAGA